MSNLQTRLSPSDFDILIVILILDIYENEIEPKVVNALKRGLTASSSNSESIAEQLDEWLTSFSGLDEKYLLISSKIGNLSTERDSGSLDLVGLGAVIGHVKDFLIRMTEISSEKEQKKVAVQGMILDNERKSIDNERAKLENISILIKMAQELGYSSEEIIHAMKSGNNESSGIFQLLELRNKAIEAADEDF